jgi:hypothetical protein
MVRPHFFVAYIATAFADKQVRPGKSDEQRGVPQYPAVAA